MESARTHLDQAVVHMASVRPPLSPRLQGLVAKADKALQLARQGMDLAPVAPVMLGQTTPYTFLVLLQNEDELRPTGGYITSVGRVKLDRGKIVEFSFSDNRIDDFTRPYPDLPHAMARYMGLGDYTELWTFRDSNWSPDFPTSAKQAAYFYTYGQQVPVDAVVAVDQRAVQTLVTAIGPLKVAITDTETIVTGEQVVDLMREAWKPPGGKVTAEWFGNRKEFIGRLAETLKAKIETNPGDVPWAAVARVALQVMDERHLILYAFQPDVAAVLARSGWDGAIQRSDGDYVMVVDANLGYNKANTAIQQTAHYTVNLSTLAAPQVALRLDYVHNHPLNEACRQVQPYADGITYQSMMNSCYYDYVRVYVPHDSRLVASNRQSIPGSYFLSRTPVDEKAEVCDPEAGKSVFATFLVVESGGRGQALFEYLLPGGIVQRHGDEWEYSLRLQKQAGKLALPTVVTVELPPAARLVSAAPMPAEVQGHTVRFELPLTQDTFVRLRFQN